VPAYSHESDRWMVADTLRLFWRGGAWSVVDRRADKRRWPSDPFGRLRVAGRVTMSMRSRVHEHITLHHDPLSEDTENSWHRYRRCGIFSGNQLARTVGLQQNGTDSV